MPLAIVVFGGSCFMGRTFVLRAAELLRKDGVQLHGVVMLNRGTVYWDAPLNEGNAPLLQHIAWDRDEDDAEATEEATAALGQWLRQAGATGPTDVMVIDFSCDDGGQLQRALSMLAFSGIEQGTSIQLRKYVLISTDSVYAPRRRSATSNSAVRSLVDESWPLLGEVARCDVRSYGYRKLEIERCLLAAEQSLGPRVVLALRLPDVVGPFDDSSRWWATQLWGQFEPHRVYVTESCTERLVCFVFSHDVVNVLLSIAEAVGTGTADGHHGVVNVASFAVSLADAVRDISGAEVLVGRRCAPFESESGLKSSSAVTSSDDDDDDCALYYPSVEIPPLDVSRFHLMFPGIRFTQWGEACSATRDFFRDATARALEGGYANEFRRAMRKLPRWVRFAVRSGDFARSD